MSTTLTAPQKEQDISAPMDAVLREFHWTVDPFYRAGDIRAFHEPLNVELVRGRLIEHSGQTPRHSYTVTCLAERMRNALQPRLNVQEHRPLHVAPDTETNTDLLVFTGNKRDYRERHPSPQDVALLVEVADVSTEYDTGEKAHLYAQVGVQECWVLLPDTETLLVHRKPSVGGYLTVMALGLDEKVSPLTVPEMAFTVRDLLGVPAEDRQPERNSTARQGYDRPTPHEVHWTVETFDRACDAGVFGPEARLELIHGRILEKMSQSLLHANVVEYCADCLRAALTPRFRVREEKPIYIAFDGKPIPDIALVRGQLTDSHQPLPQPADVVLLVEVAVSSADGDLGGKALLYAQAGISDYWVVLPEEGHIVVHHTPSPDGYASVTTHGVGEAITPLAATDIILTVAALLGDTSRPEYENA